MELNNRIKYIVKLQNVIFIELTRINTDSVATLFIT
jgi:hypothetical protein